MTTAQDINESPPSVDSSEEFMTRVALALSPALMDPFSDATRKVGNYLMIVSVVLILIILGFVEKSARVTVPWIGIELTNTDGLRWTLILICIYFEVTFLTRSRPEWALWCLKQQAPAIKLDTMISDIYSKHTAGTAELMNKVNENSGLGFKRVALLKELQDLSTTAMSLYMKKLDLLDEIRQLESGSAHAGTESREMRQQARAKRDEIEKLDGEVATIDAQKAQLRERVSNLQKQWTELYDQLTESNSARNQFMADLRARLEVINEWAKPASKTIKRRGLIEMIFPLAFGLITIVLGIFVSLRPILLQLHSR